MNLIEGVIFEFGVCGGGSIKKMGKLFEDRSIFGFDHFWGLTEEWRNSPVGAYSTKGKQPDDLPENVEIVELEIVEKLPSFMLGFSEPLAFVHFDLDTYTPTKVALDSIKPNMRDGTFLLFDQCGEKEDHAIEGDRAINKHEYKAVQDFLRENADIEFEAIPIEKHSKHEIVRDACSIHPGSGKWRKLFIVRKK